MSTPRSDELLFAAGGDVWEKYGTFVKRTLPEEERGTFSRSSDATYTDRSGSLRTAESGILRPHYVSSESSYSARLEAARTNELHNFDSPATQTRNLTAGTYTLWMEGSGSVDASGATDGSYGTATEGQSNDLTFTVSAQQDVTFTVNNTVTRFQCEEGSFRSSFITTGGSAVSRAADDLSVDHPHDPQAMSVYAKRIETGGASFTNSRLLSIGDINTEPFVNWRSNGSIYRWIYRDGTNTTVVAPGTAPAYGDTVELLGVIKSDGSIEGQQSINGGSVSTATDSGTTVAGGWSVNTVFIGQGNFSSRPTFVDLVSLVIAPGVRTMDEMRSVEV